MLNDLQSLDPDVHRQLLWLRRCDSVDELDLTFSLMDGARQRDLVPNGRDTPVTRDNRIRYIYLVANFRLNVQIRPLCAAFLDGIGDLMDLKWLRLFDENELQQLISGGRMAINTHELQANTVYHRFAADDVTIQLFWKVVHVLTDEQKRMLLKFVTGCSGPPLLGFEHMTPKFAIGECVMFPMPAPADPLQRRRGCVPAAVGQHVHESAQAAAVLGRGGAARQAAARHRVRHGLRSFVALCSAALHASIHDGADDPLGEGWAERVDEGEQAQMRRVVRLERAHSTGAHNGLRRLVGRVPRHVVQHAFGVRSRVCLSCISVPHCRAPRAAHRVDAAQHCQRDGHVNVRDRQVVPQRLEEPVWRRRHDGGRSSSANGGRAWRQRMARRSACPSCRRRWRRRRSIRGWPAAAPWPRWPRECSSAC